MPNQILGLNPSFDPEDFELTRGATEATAMVTDQAKFTNATSIDKRDKL